MRVATFYASAGILLISFDGETFVVALGIAKDGRKLILGLRQGATENAAAPFSKNSFYQR